MVKSLLNICLEIVQKSCAFETDLKLNWLSCGLQCMPFKFCNKLVADGFFYCVCNIRGFNITLNPNFFYSIAVRARNCFFCWFVNMFEIKVELLFKYRNNMVRLISLLDNFLKFIDKYKYIYISPNFQNMEYDFFETFNFYLDLYKLCLCCCKYHDDYFKLF